MSGEICKKIVQLIREEFDPTPVSLKLPRGEWADNAEAVADKIMKLCRQHFRAKKGPWIDGRD